MNLAALLKQKRNEILEAAARNGAHNLRVFGSVARGDFNENSDVDFLVDLEPGRSLFDLSSLISELEEILEVKVDVGTYRMLKSPIKEQILKESISL